MQSVLHSLNDEHPTQCPACNKYLRTPQGLSAHLTSARKCLWYKKGKLSELKVHMDNDATVSQEEESQRPIATSQSHREQDPAELINEFNDRAFDFIPLAAISTDDPPPGPSCCTGSNKDEVADECVDEWVEEYPFPTAGQVIHMERTLHEKWRLLFRHEDLDGDAAMDDGASSEQQFSPFASELDWRVASWAVQEGIGHKCLNQLLAIPGVSSLFGDTRLMLISCPCSGGGAPRPILPQYTQAPSGR